MVGGWLDKARGTWYNGLVAGTLARASTYGRTGRRGKGRKHAETFRNAKFLARFS